MSRVVAVVLAVVLASGCSGGGGSGGPDAAGSTCEELRAAYPVTDELESCDYTIPGATGTCSPVRIGAGGEFVCIARDFDMIDDAGSPACVLVTCELR
jgi:hypothetical protein